MFNFVAAIGDVGDSDDNNDARDNDDIYTFVQTTR